MPADPTIPASSVIGRACLDGWRGPVTYTGRAFDTDGPRECVLLGPDARPESERIGPWLVSATDGEGWYVLDCLCEVLSVTPDDLALDLSRREVRLRVVDVLGQGVKCPECNGVGDEPGKERCECDEGAGYLIRPHDARHLLEGPPLGTAGITAAQSAILLAAHVAGVEAGGPGVRGIVRGIVTMDGVASAVLVGGGCIGGWSRRADGWHVRLNHGAQHATMYASESEANAAFCEAAREAGYALLDADGGVRVPS